MRDLPRARFFSSPREHNFSDEVEGSDDEGCALERDAPSTLSSSPAALRVKRTDGVERALLEVYDEVVTEMGRLSDGASLASSHWSAVASSLNERRGAKPPLTKDKLQSRPSVLKRKHGVWRRLGGLSGFKSPPSRLHTPRLCFNADGLLRSSSVVRGGFAPRLSSKEDATALQREFAKLAPSEK